MSSGTSRIAFVVATKDRPEDLRKMLASLAGQSRRPDEVIIVDASAQPVEHVAAEFPRLAIRYIRHLPPSASAQRNAQVLHAIKQFLSGRVRVANQWTHGSPS